MPEFTIRFEGLIVHANLNTKWVSAMIAADEHRAALAVPNDALRDDHTLPVLSKTDSETLFKLEGAFVRCDLPSGMPTKGPTFDRGVARLSQVAVPGNLPPRLTAQTATVDTAAFWSLFELPAGLLSAVDFFERPAQFGPQGEIRCVAQTVELTSDSPSNTVTFSTSNGMVSVDAAKGPVRFENVSPTSTRPARTAVFPPGDPRADHFLFYSRFFDGGGITLRSPRTSLDFTCTLAGLKETRISVECSNTQYP